MIKIINKIYWMKILSQINKPLNLQNSYIISYKRTPFGNFLG